MKVHNNKFLNFFFNNNVLFSRTMKISMCIPNIRTSFQLRAVVSHMPYMINLAFYTGNVINHIDVRTNISNL
jgi:hypothetical protein